MLDKEQRKDLLKTETTCASIFLRIESVLPPFLIRLQIRPSVVEFESTFPPGEGKGAAAPIAHNRIYRIIKTSPFVRGGLHNILLLAECVDGNTIINQRQFFQQILS